MNEIIISAAHEVATQELSEKLAYQWTSYIDATPKTIETYNRAIKQFFKYLAEQGIHNPQRDDILAYREYLRADHKPTTIQGYLAAVKLFFQWTEQSGYYPNIATRVKGAKVDRGHKKDYLTTKQASRLLQSIDTSTIQGKRDYAIIALMLTTGLRTVSIVNANVGDIRAAGDAIALYYKGKGHEEKATYVKLSDQVEQAIREHLATRLDTSDTAPLFTSASNRNGGERMTTRSISRLVKDHLKAAGYNSDRLTAHSLRHTAATLALMNGATIEEAQQLLDHANINTTLIYSHAIERAKNNSEYRISKAIFG